MAICNFVRDVDSLSLAFIISKGVSSNGPEICGKGYCLLYRYFLPNTLLRRNLKIELKEGLALIILFFSIFQNDFNTKFHEESIFVVFVGRKYEMYALHV